MKPRPVVPSLEIDLLSTHEGPFWLEGLQALLLERTMNFSNVVL